MSNPYRLFASESGDWYVAAKMTGDGQIVVLFDGHDRAQAYEAILREEGLLPEREERNMEATGNYDPVAADWE